MKASGRQTHWGGQNRP